LQPNEPQQPKPQDRTQRIELPKNEVVFAAKDGRTVVVQQLAETQAEVQWRPAAGEEIPEEAKKALEEGQAHRVEKRRDEAIAAFERARELAPRWPHPLQEIALVHLLCQEWDDALKAFEAVDAMEPRGFFQAKPAVWTLRKEGAGELPRGTFLAYCQILFARDARQQHHALQQLVQHAPAFAPGWHDLAAMQRDATEAQQLIQNGIAAQPDADTMGKLLSKLAMVYLAQGKEDAAADIVGHLVLDTDGTRATRYHAADVLLKIHVLRKQRDAADAAAADREQAPE